MRTMVLLLATTVALVACGGQETDGEQSAEPPVDTTQTAEQVAPEPTPDTTPPQVTQQPPRQRPASGDTSAQGTVRILGADPFAQPVIQTGSDATQSVGVQGPLRPEITALSGAEVRVWGKPVANRPPTPPRAIEVTRYRVVSVGGEPAYAGVLEMRGEQTWLRGERAVRLTSVPRDLTERMGATIWVTGVLTGDTLRVRSHGVIRQP